MAQKGLRVSITILEEEVKELFADPTLEIGKHFEKIFNERQGCACEDPLKTCPYKAVQHDCIKLVLDAAIKTEKPEAPK